MSHRWQHEDEYLALKTAFRQAEEEGDIQRCKELSPRIAELDNMLWHAKTEVFLEMAPYRSVVDALRHTADRMGIPFPDLDNQNIRTGDGILLFAITDGIRTVQIWPMQSRRYYKVDLFTYEESEQGRCYIGRTASLEEATRALSYWFVERWTILELREACPSIPTTPFQLDKPRFSFE